MWSGHGRSSVSTKSRGHDGDVAMEQSGDMLMFEGARQRERSSRMELESTGHLVDRQRAATEYGTTMLVSGGNIQEDGICTYRLRGFPLVARVSPVSRYCRCCCYVGRD